MLKKIFFVAVFLTLTFPRSGVYINTLPLTIPNIIFGIISLTWIFKRIYYKNCPKGTLEWIGLTYFIYVFLSAVFGLIQGERLNALIGLATMAGYGVLFFLTIYFIKTRRDVLFISRLIIFSLVLIITYGALQVILDIQSLSIPGLTELYGSPQQPITCFKDGWIQVISGRALSKNIMWGAWGGVISLSSPVLLGHKVFSTFHHGNLFGSHLAIFIPFLFSMALISSAKKKIPLYLFLIIAIVVLIFTNSRAALFALMAGFLSLMIFLSPLDRFRLFSLIIISFLIFILIISLAVSYGVKITGIDPSGYLYHNLEPRYFGPLQKAILFWQSKIKAGYNETESLRYSQDLHNFTNQRFRVCRDSFLILFRSERPLRAILFGNNFKEPSYKYGNFYLWMIFENGMVGFGLFLVFIGYIIITSMRFLNYIKDQKLNAIGRGGLSGLIGGLVHNLIDAPFYYSPILANFWILAGLVIVISKVAKEYDCF